MQNVTEVVWLRKATELIEVEWRWSGGRRVRRARGEVYKDLPWALESTPSLPSQGFF